RNGPQGLSVRFLRPTRRRPLVSPTQSPSLRPSGASVPGRESAHPQPKLHATTAALEGPPPITLRWPRLATRCDMKSPCPALAATVSRFFSSSSRALCCFGKQPISLSAPPKRLTI